MSALAKRRETLDGHLAKLRRRPDRKLLTQAYLLALHERQRGLCALTGVRMTWTVGSGRVFTNISIDRIAPKGIYAPGNVRLVCAVANLMRRDMPDHIFTDWCRLVVKNAVPLREVA